MLRHLIYALITLLACCTAGAQPASARLGALLNAKDWLALRAQWPALRDSVDLPWLNLLAQAQLGLAFNRPAQAQQALDSLLAHHQEQLGTDASLALAGHRAMNLLNQGRYAEAGEAGGQLVEALKGVMPYDRLHHLIFIERVGKALAHVPAPSIARPAHDVEVPLRWSYAGRGRETYMQTQVNGVTRDFIFDTGCAFGNMVSERCAAEMGLQVLADSVPLTGVGGMGYVRVATADSMRVGEITCYHPMFLVMPPNEAVDTIFAFDGVLGHGFINAVGEVVVDNTRGVFVFPAQSTLGGEPNAWLVNNGPWLRASCNGSPYDILLDTGCGKTSLGPDYAAKFPQAVAGLEQHDDQHGGFGGLNQVKAVTLPEFDFSIGTYSATLHNVDVETVGAPNSAGLLGVDFVLGCKRLTINYRDMIVRAE